MTTVIATLEQAITRATSDRESASKSLIDLTNRADNLKAEVDSLDVDIESHYAAIGRIHCRAITAAG